MFDKLEDIPFNLDPNNLDISYDHGEPPLELKPYFDGSFFIDLAKNNHEKFNIEFLTFFDARTFFIYDWDGETLTKIEVEVADMWEDEADGICSKFDSDDEIWDEAIDYEEAPQEALDYANKKNLVSVIYKK
jgi:hypothetical protein|tara:strand:- start:95 stop:490 length:396 start_codon:yes stop_codon:yes gene_type:complete